MSDDMQKILTYALAKCESEEKFKEALQSFQQLGSEKFLRVSIEKKIKLRSDQKEEVRRKIEHLSYDQKRMLKRKPVTIDDLPRKVITVLLPKLSAKNLRQLLINYSEEDMVNVEYFGRPSMEKFINFLDQYKIRELLIIE